MPKLIKRDRGNYTNVSNIVVRDSRLSWKARGIFLYLWSQANEWQFYVSEIATHATDGESALRSGLKELEQYGYLERNHRHNDSGSFDGMNWILTDTPEQDFDHHAKNRNDAKIKEKPPKMSEKCNDAKITQKAGKMSEKASYGKPIRCETHPMENRSLRNNNNKNYQYKEISNNKSSSSNDEIKDPFAGAGEADDDEEVITGLIEMFSKEAHVSIPNYQYNHIKSNLLAMDQSDAIDLMYTVVNKVNRGEVQNPIGYLITSITSVKGGD
jgi:hypothetical protein